MTDLTLPAGSPWPEAHLDPIARLRVIESAVPSLIGAERVIDAPFDDVWSWIADLEISVPTFDHSVSKLRIAARTGADLDVRAQSFGVPISLRFDARLEPGLCIMRARRRLYFVGMAAVAEGDRTRFRHVEGVPLPAVGRVARPLVGREVRSDLAGIAAHFEC